jgi:D-glycero-D-manno-heptose 1,7-bisphosphate phosphatase
MMQCLMAVGGRLDAVFFCPHTPEENCDCRKPKPGLMRQIGLRYGIDLRTVPMLCDTLRDLQAARAAGCEPHLVLSGRAAGLSEAQLVDIVAQVPGTEVHEDLDGFVDFLLQRAHVPDSSPMGLH